MIQGIDRIETEITEWADGITTSERKVVFTTEVALYVDDTEGRCRVTSVIHTIESDGSENFYVRGRLQRKDGKGDRRTWSHHCGHMALGFFGEEL